MLELLAPSRNVAGEELREGCRSCASFTEREMVFLCPDLPIVLLLGLLFLNVMTPLPMMSLLMQFSILGLPCEAENYFYFEVYIYLANISKFTKSKDLLPYTWQRRDTVVAFELLL